VPGDAFGLPLPPDRGCRPSRCNHHGLAFRHRRAGDAFGLPLPPDRGCRPSTGRSALRAPRAGSVWLV